MKKNNPDRRACEKSNLAAPILSEKTSFPGSKTQAPPPPRISNGPCLSKQMYLFKKLWKFFKANQDGQELFGALSGISAARKKDSSG